MIVNLDHTPGTQEKRRAHRKTVVARVRIGHSTFGVIEAFTRNISDNGVYVNLHHQPHLPIGAHIKLHMLDSALPEIEFNMRVVRTDEVGVSLAFVDYEIRGKRYPITTLEEIMHSIGQRER